MKGWVILPSSSGWLNGNLPSMVCSLARWPIWLNWKARSAAGVFWSEFVFNVHEEEEEEEEGEESSQANWPLSLSFWEKRHWEEALFKLHLVHPFLIISTPNILRPSLGTDYKSKYVIIYYVSRTLNRQLGGLLRLHHFIFIYNAPC